VAPTSIRKAALLLKNLEPKTAAELLKAAPPDLVKQIAAELVVLDASGHEEGWVDSAIEFLRILHDGGASDLRTFIRSMIVGALGPDQSEEILREVGKMVDGRDPFIPVRQADPPLLAEALKGLHPQAAAMVLMELDPEKSAALIPMLDDSVRGEAIRRMAIGEKVSAEAQGRVAALIRDRLVALEASGKAVEVPVGPSGKVRLRRVALLMRRLRRDLRDSLLETIKAKDAEQARQIQDLMVTWDDLPLVSDRNLQDVLRTMDADGLALAIHEADKKTSDKIRRNISERAVAMLEEEISLMRRPKPEDIDAAREKILTELRQLNAAGELTFEEADAHAVAAR
jgi:flagellar motor switch protein FliG